MYSFECLYKDKEKLIQVVESLGYEITKAYYFRKDNKEMYRIEAEKQ